MTTRRPTPDPSLLQLIFRKVADVKREQELAERRKNEPPVADLAQDHLVRKIFSKFRKPSDAGTFGSRPGSSQVAKVAPKPVTMDPEAGTKERRESGETLAPKGKGDPDSGSESRASTAKSKLSRWTAALGTNATDTRVETEEKEDKEAGNRRTELVCRKSEHIHVVKDVRPPTQGNKWPKVSAPRPDTIDETAEGEGTATTEATSRPRASVTSLLPVKTGLSSSDLQQLVSTLLEIKVDIKSEIQKVNNRINRIDQQVEEVSSRLLAAHQQMLDRQRKQEQEIELETESRTRKRESRSPRSRTTTSKSRSTGRHSRSEGGDSMRVKLEKEIAEQVTGTDEDQDQDLTSKL